MNLALKKSILIVEDDVDLCNAVLRSVKKEDYLPTGVTSVREAMFRLKNQKYTCIVLDMKLDGGESGEAVIEFVRKNKDLPNFDTPILVTSGLLDASIVQKIRQYIQGALVKPYEIASLVEHLKRLTH